MGWTIRRAGLEHELVEGEQKRETVLLVEGAEVDRQTAEYWEEATLSSGDLTFEVHWGPRNTITSARLLTGDHPVPLTPPPGSRPARREAFAREHPRLFVLQRVGIAAAEIVLGVLGVSAVLNALLGQLVPRIDLSWVPRPHLPDIDPPDWLRYLDPFYWLSRLGLSWPDVELPGWVDGLLASSKYWVPLVVAAVIARGELTRRRRQQDERDDPGTDPSDDASP